MDVQLNEFPTWPQYQRSSELLDLIGFATRPWMLSEYFFEVLRIHYPKLDDVPIWFRERLYREIKNFQFPFIFDDFKKITQSFLDFTVNIELTDSELIDYTVYKNGECLLRWTK